MKNMKIVHYMPIQFPVRGYGGTERIAFWLGKAQAEMGHQVTYLCQKDGELPFANTIDVPGGIEDLTEYIPSDTDIVQLYNVFPNSLEIAPQLGIENRRIKTPKLRLDFPFLVGIHGNGQVDEAYHPNSVFVSRNHAQRHNWTEYVYNGVDISEYPMCHSKDDYLLFLAKANWTVKNLAGAIRVANQVRLPLHVAGGKAPPWSRNVISHGTIDGTQKLNLLQKSRALIFPVIWNEPFGVAVIEALASGTPVIATNVGALPEIIDSTCGAIANSLSGLVDAVSSVKLLDPCACRQQVEKRFTHIHMAENYLRYYKKILQTGNIRDGYPFAPKKVEKYITYKQPFRCLAGDSIVNACLRFF
jgi:glycosyltransferase involved in cell wall biosynthesis